MPVEQLNSKLEPENKLRSKTRFERFMMKRFGLIGSLVLKENTPSANLVLMARRSGFSALYRSIPSYS